MGSGRHISLRVRTGMLAAIVIPLVVLVGIPASVWHADHADERECAVCHSGHQTADFARPVELAPSHVPERIERMREVRRVESRRYLRQPARAPPA